MTPQDVARSLIDTLGSIAQSVGDAPASSPEETHSSSSSGSGSVGGGGGGNSAAIRGTAVNRDGRIASSANNASAGAFGFAVDELARMCGEDGEVAQGAANAQGTRGWALLGLPLR